MQKLEDFIRIYEDVFPADLANQLMDMTRSLDTAPWQPALTNEGFDHLRLDALSIFLSHPVIHAQTPWINDGIRDAVARVRQMHIEEFAPADSVREDTGYTLMRYLEGGYHTEHVDCDTQHPRMMTVSFVLNDGFEGGEHCFFQKELVYRIPRLAAIVFPSNFQYPHEISPVTQGERWSIDTWLN